MSYHTMGYKLAPTISELTPLQQMVVIIVSSRKVGEE